MTSTTFAAIRDVILLLAGLALLWHETVVVTDPRLPLLAMAVALLGLPATLFVDRKFIRSLPPPPERRETSQDEQGDRTPESR